MIDPIAYHFELGFAASALIMLRIMMLPLLFYNMSWSYKGFIQLIKGTPLPTPIYQTVVFTFSLGVAGYHTLALLGRQVSVWSIPWSLTLNCIIMLGVIAGVIGRQVSVNVNFEKFYWLFEQGHLDIAVRAARINEIDPKLVDEALEVAETRATLALANRVVDG